MPDENTKTKIEPTAGNAPEPSQPLEHSTNTSQDAGTEDVSPTKRNNDAPKPSSRDKTIVLHGDAALRPSASASKPSSKPPAVDKTVVLPAEDKADSKDSSSTPATKSTTIHAPTTKLSSSSGTSKIKKGDRSSPHTKRGTASRRNIKTFIGDTLDIIASTFGKGDSEKTNFFTTVKSDNNDSAERELNRMKDVGIDDLGTVERQYKFCEMIAEGGQGAVKKAIDKLFHRIVAVKSLHDDIKEKADIRTSFIDEAEITAQLDHPSIVPVYGLYSDDTHGLHLAMKLVNGQTLRKYLDTLAEQYEAHIKANIALREHKMLRQRLEVFLKICDAMTYAHSKHIIHRDLKPENIMIGRFNETYIMDWGIAQKLENGTSYTPSTISGTPRYIPPELLNKQPIDRRSDIYLLGLILYEIVFLKKAYPQRQAEDALRAAKEGEIAPLEHAFGIAIDRDLKAIVATALAFDPADRYSSVARMAEDIRNYMNDEAVSVSPYPRLSALMRMMRRHSKLIFTLLMLMGVILFAGSTAAVFREINNQLEADKIENTLSQVFTETLHTAHSIDTQFRNIGAHMQLFTEELAFRMNTLSPNKPISDFYDYKAGLSPETAPPEFKYHPNYSAYVSFKTFMHKLAPGAKPENLQLVLNAFDAMLPTFECYMQMHGKKNINHDFPILSLYTGFESGLHVSYPYNSDYKDDYDPRLRTWYTSAQMSKANTPTWTKPYINKAKVKQLVMTCSVPFKTAGGELIGVMGADVLPETLQEILHANTSNKNFIISKYIVSKDGEICQD
ncbi:MAG: protein kinase, partial [Victivallales bacterium]|nr:protein kinase [Victivallales bacterium]